jgi:hypothetical protein
MLLADGEYITAVHGCATPDHVHQLRFVTTHANTKATNHDHPVFGGGNYVESFCWEAPPGMMLIGFNIRRCHQLWNLEQLAPIWAPCPALR